MNIRKIAGGVASRASSLRLWIYERSIWHPTAIEPEHFEYRHLKRIWLPVFDVLSILVGVLGMAYGSRVLNELYSGEFVDAVSIIFAVASAIALVGISLPKLFIVEASAKVVMLSLLGGYSAAIWASFFEGNVESGFVAAMLMYPILYPLLRLQMIGEGVKKNREED